MFASYTPENVENLIAAHEQKLNSVAQSAREEAGRVSQQQEALRRKAARRRRVMISTVTTLLLIAGLAAAAVFWALPAYHYYQASTLLADGEYDTARDAFHRPGRLPRFRRFGEGERLPQGWKPV